MNIVISDAGREWRGTETVTRHLAAGLRERGHHVVVFCIRDSPLDRLLRSEGITTEAILGGSDVSPRVLLRCWRALARHAPDVVITQKDKDLRWTGLTARLRGVPVLARHVTDRPLKSKLRYRFFFGWVATHHVANSRATRDTLLASAPWLTDTDIPIVRNGIEVKRFANAAAIELDLPDESVVIGFAGRFETRKGLADFAAAWRQIAERLPDAHALIAGAGPRETEFRSAVGDAPRVHWLGFRQDLERVFKRMDILVMPSHFEGFGLVLVEAMAAGVASVAYAASNLPEVIEHGRDGILVPPGDTAALAQAVIKLAECPQLRQILATNAQHKAREQFACERMVAEYEALAMHAARKS